MGDGLFSGDVLRTARTAPRCRTLGNGSEGLLKECLGAGRRLGWSGEVSKPSVCLRWSDGLGVQLIPARHMYGHL